VTVLLGGVAGAGSDHHHTAMDRSICFGGAMMIRKTTMKET
jgi:hypothetical protein